MPLFFQASHFISNCWNNIRKCHNTIHADTFSLQIDLFLHAFKRTDKRQTITITQNPSAQRSWVSPILFDWGEQFKTHTATQIHDAKLRSQCIQSYFYLHYGIVSTSLNSLKNINLICIYKTPLYGYTKLKIGF